MAAAPIFPTTSMKAGMYESFFLRAVNPDMPVGVWIRNTVHKPPGRPPSGSIWCTVFDASWRRPLAHKLTSNSLEVPVGGWIAIGRAADAHGGYASLSPGRAQGECGQARWSLRFASTERELRHLSPERLYRLPIPRTKLTSPAPAARFDGELELAQGDTLELRGWPGTVGHNWGAAHAERWIWLHGIGFREESDAWLDVALGRVRVAGRLTPWVANGALSLDGRRYRLGGLTARRPLVAESASGCNVQLRGADGVEVEVGVQAPAQAVAGWRYSDPTGGGRDVINCSIAALELTVRIPGRAPRTVATDHGGAYELGMREHDHGVPIAPFPDG
jgi:hypothetical protein